MTVNNHKAVSVFTFDEYAKGRAAFALSAGFFQKIKSLPDYHWVLVGAAVAMLPHVFFAPVWLTVIAYVSVIAQLPVIKRKITAKKGVSRLKGSYRFVQMGLFLAGLVGIWLTFQSVLGVDVAVSFLTLCLFCKLWELQQKRDAYVVLNLSLFVLASVFLLSQGLGVALLVMTAGLGVMMGFLALNDDGNHSGEGRGKTLGLLVVMALPLLVVLFLFFPRIPPLWSVNLAGNKSTTGISDSMSPGDFADLSKSTELAFRATFDGRPPSRSGMYWRGLVFTDFDGITWRQIGVPNMWRTLDPMPNWARYDGEPLATYQILLEPTHQNWLFALDYPKPASMHGVMMSEYFTLERLSPIDERFGYAVSQYPSTHIEFQLSDAERKRNIALPNNNVQAKLFAKSLYAQVGKDPVRYIEAIENHIRQNNFRYTLSPPPLQGEQVDGFLFGTQAGFCEHYSSSFVVLMRAVDIPARVVTGYQGGQSSKDGKTWEVRQMDAHAWSEVWLENQGWVRIDPTAFIASERVEDGMDSLTSSRGADMFGDGVAGTWAYNQFKFLNTVRRYSDQIGYYWLSDVVGFDSNKQKKSLLQWFNISSFYQQIKVMAGAFLAILGVIVGVIWYRRRKVYHLLDMPIIRLSHKLGKQNHGLKIGTSEPPLAWLDRLGAAGVDRQAVDELKVLYRKGRYGRPIKKQEEQKLANAMMSVVNKMHTPKK